MLQGAEIDTQWWNEWETENKKKQKHDTGKAVRKDSGLCFIIFNSSIFARKLTQYSHVTLTPHLYHNTLPAVIHTKEFESSLG